nr:hypothetical protein BgiMline_021059 [Biomphalaria glabrata]
MFSSDSVSLLTPIHVLIRFSFTPNSYPCSHQIQFHSYLLSMFSSDSVSLLTPIHVLIRFSFTPNSYPCSHQIQFHS